MSPLSKAMVPVAVRDGQPTNGSPRISHPESPCDVTAEDWHAQWHDEDEASSAPTLPHHLHRAAFVYQNAKKADNQTSFRLFGAARPQVRLPPPLPATSKTNARLPAVVPELIQPSGSANPSSAKAAAPRSSEDSQTLLKARPPQDAGPTTLSSMPSVTRRKTAEDSCPICEGSYTHDEPGMRTPCCGLAVHELCNYYALEDHAVCHGCHREQVPAEMSEPGSHSETEEYIRHFDSTPQASSTCSLKSEQAGTSSKSSGVMTLREFVESHAGLRSATSSLDTDASSASFSWLSSVEDEDFDDDDSLSNEGSSFAFVTGPSSPQAASASSCEGPDSILAEALHDSQPSPPEPSSGEPTTAEALGILDGATEHLANACRKVGMYVSEDYKDTVVERLLVALEDPSCRQLTSRAGSVEARPLDPPLPITEIELAMRSTTSSLSPKEQCRLPRSIALRAPSSGSSPVRAIEPKKRAPTAPPPEEIRDGGRKEDMKRKPKALITYEIIGYG